MHRVEERITIERAPDEVFAFVTEPSNHPLWSSVEASEIVDDELRIGAQIRTVGRFLGRKLEFTSEVTQYDPPKTIRMKAVDGPFDVTESYQVEATGEGCQLTIAGETPGLGGFFGTIGDPLVVKMYARPRAGRQGALRAPRSVRDAHRRGQDQRDLVVPVRPSRRQGVPLLRRKAV